VPCGIASISGNYILDSHVENPHNQNDRAAVPDSYQAIFVLPKQIVTNNLLNNILSTLRHPLVVVLLRELILRLLRERKTKKKKRRRR
jgi:hypothetical protein